MKEYFLIFLLILATRVFGDRSCGPEFLEKCKCGMKIFDNQEQYVVNCTNEGFKDTDILMNLPPETQVLIFSGNNIPEIPWNIFGTFDNLPKLRVVDMSYNHIKEIKGKAYHHVKNVERLILNHNELIISEDEEEANHHHPRVLSNFINLKELHLTNAFVDNTDATLADDLHDIFVNSNLSKLYKLHLEQNEIVSFRDHRVFCDLPQLHDLYLGDNLLIRINFNMTCLKHLRYVDLENNKIEELTKQELNNMDKVQAALKKESKFTVNFKDNPFPCDCSISDFTSWLKTTNVTVKNLEELRCVKPKGSLGGQLMKMKPCKVGKSPPSKRQKTTVGLVIFVTIFVLSVVILLIYASRYRLRTKITPIIEAITKKVQYTTIKNRDNIDDT